MNNDIAQIEDRIKDVIAKNEDAIKGFHNAAENAKSVGVKTYFEKRAKSREQFLVTLHNATPALKTGDTSIDSTNQGVIHRVWMDVKAFFATDNDEAMLEEAIRGDKSAIEEYNELLADVLVPVRIKEIIREQKDTIQNDLETSKILEEQL